MCRNRNAILSCNISRSFADHSSMILNSKVDKFYTGLTIIIQKNRRVNFEWKFNTFRNYMPPRKHLSTSIKPSRLWKKYNSIWCVAGKELNFSGQVWCEQYKSKKSTILHETKVQFRPLAVYHIFYNTDTYSLFSLYKRGGIENKALKKKN